MGPLSGWEARRVRVAGRVQGVGFRPFVARTATALGLAGWVRNTPESNVEIHIEGPPDALDAFLDRLRREPPPASDVRTVDVTRVEPDGANRPEFLIVASATTTGASLPTSGGLPVVTPDMAACPECQAEFLDPADRRFGYALTACTACGPRLTAITVLPFDRERTAMAEFPLCPSCRLDYESPSDRRYHAEMTCCAACGPRYFLEPALPADDVSAIRPRPLAPGQSFFPIDFRVLDDAARRLHAGEIVAVKGLGGFHLLCDATSEEAVMRLRHRKRRERKPFAVMFADVDSLEAHLEADPVGRAALTAPAAPIVLLARRPESTLAPGVAPGLATVGAMLAYTPAHRALVRLAGRPLVATSANASDEPMPIDNETARAELSGVADAFLLHNRTIERPADDSVVRVIGGRAAPIRVGRGLAPVRLSVPADLPSALAVGGHLKAAVAFCRGDTIALGTHVGDLSTPSVRRRYREVVADFGRLFQVEPEAVVCDKHPDYFSTRLAQETGLPLIAVQHHVAHAAATLAEYGEVGPALAITWDGTGLGDDGGIWGGEFFRVEPGRAERIAALWPFPLVGGDRAAKEPRRSAAGVLFAAEAWETPGAQACVAGWFSESERRILEAALHAPHVAMTCTSAGRLFDAWAALLGLSDRAAFEAEPAMRLEDAVDPREDGALSVVMRADPDRLEAADPTRPCWRIDWRPWVEETRRALEQGTDPRVLAARFHNGLAQACLEIAWRVGLETVVLGGGCFQNARLSNRVEALLDATGFRVLTPRRVPAGDGGLAVGQLWAAALGLPGAKLGTLR